MVEDGIIIKNVTLADDGEYTCRAEVEIDGRYDERKIIVAVHSKSPEMWSLDSFIFLICALYRAEKWISTE